MSIEEIINHLDVLACVGEGAEEEGRVRDINGANAAALREAIALLKTHHTHVEILKEYTEATDGIGLKRLRELAQAEKSGRLVVLPVNPCLTPTNQNEMYICENGEVWAIYVTGCETGPNSDGVFTVEYMTLDGDVFSADDIGKTVFLTREEAEAALREEEG